MPPCRGSPVFYKLKKKKIPQSFTSGSFTELFQKYKDNAVPQSVSSNGAQVFINYIFFIFETEIVCKH